jgi:hypothetical protein
MCCSLLPFDLAADDETKLDGEKVEKPVLFPRPLAADDASVTFVLLLLLW